MWIKFYKCTVDINYKLDLIDTRIHKVLFQSQLEHFDHGMHIFQFNTRILDLT